MASDVEADIPVSSYVLNGYYSSNDMVVRILDLLPKVENNLVLTMVVSLLEHLLDEDVWGYYDEETRVEIRPTQVISTNQPQEHYKRILEADLSYPILVYFDDNGSLQVIDGMHRLAKAVMCESDYILVKVVDKSQMKGESSSEVLRF